MPRIDISPYKNKKSALVLSGGVVKAAAWHAGVVLALEELGFEFESNSQVHKDSASPLVSTYVASSAGTLVSLLLASGYSAQDIADAQLKSESNKLKKISYKDVLSMGQVMKKRQGNKKFNPYASLPFPINKILAPVNKINGFFTTRGLRDYLLENVLHSNDFTEYSADIFIVATQLDHSRKVVFSKYNYPSPIHDQTTHYYTGTSIADAAAASMSVPPFYSPYPIYNSQTDEVENYIDGEIRDTLSTHVAKDNKCDLIISSWTHTPYHFHQEVGTLANYGIPTICLQAIHLMIQKKIVSARQRLSTANDIIDTVHSYLSNEKFPKEKIKDVISILENKLDFNKEVKYLDIFPTYENYDLFFASSFSLNPKSLAKILKAGYRRTMEVFRHDQN